MKVRIRLTAGNMYMFGPFYTVSPRKLDGIYARPKPVQRWTAPTPTAPTVWQELDRLFRFW